MTRRVLLVLCFALACSDSAPKTPPGVYVLTAINGQAPPQIVAQDQSGTLEITAGRVTLNQDQTFTDRTDVRETSGSTVTTDFSVAVGVWDLNGNTITFTTSTNDQYFMQWSDNTLTQVESGLTLTYKR